MSAALTPGQKPPIAAEAFLRALADHGVDYMFVNPGTDFPPIVEAFARARKTNAKVPKPILVPHENLAVAMAHGAYLMNGHPQAVMVHVNVGTANTINNVTNLSRDRVPLILAAGRTPVTEKGSFGSRSRPIHWAQEMFDQAGMLRELVKWDYELRQPSQVGDVVARSVEVAMAHPRGPVYMVLPREPLSASLSEPIAPIRPRAQASRVQADPQSIAALAEWIVNAERPLIITSILPGEAVPVLAALAERFAIPVITHNPRSVCLPSSHHMHFGYEPGMLLADADLVIALKSDVPWIPLLQHPAAGARIVHVAEDTRFARYPMRSFPSDLSVQGGVTHSLEALSEQLEGRIQHTEARIAARRARLIERMRNRRAQLAKDSVPGETISPAYLSRCIGEAVGEDAVSSTNIRCAPIIACAKIPALCLRSAPVALAGALAPRLAPSSPRPTSSSSQRSETAPTCSPTQPSGTGCRKSTACRSSRSCSTTAAMARCVIRHWQCSRTAWPARMTAAISPISTRRRPMTKWRARKALLPNAWKARPPYPARWRGRATPSSATSVRHF